MNTKNTNRLITLVKESPEAKEAVEIIHQNLLTRMSSLINKKDKNDLEEGKLEAYWNIQDKLARVLNEAKR